MDADGCSCLGNNNLKIKNNLRIIGLLELLFYFQY